MRDLKTEKQLAGDEFWTKIPLIVVPGDPTAKAFPEGVSQEAGEKIVQTWNRIAVLKVSPVDVPALFGFMAGDHVQYMNVPVETDKDGRLGVRVGDGDVRFFLLPQDHKQPLTMELVEVAEQDNPNYQTMPLY